MTTEAAPPPEDPRATLCELLAPQIAGITHDYYLSLNAPYLDNPTHGGLIRIGRAVEQTEETSTVRLIDIGAMPADLGAEDGLQRWKRAGLPQTLTPNSVLWSASSQDRVYNSKGSQVVRRAAQSVSHWDGRQWHTIGRRMDVSPDSEAVWEPSRLGRGESQAFQMLAQQTRGLHQIAEVFDGDWRAFEAQILETEAARDPRILRMLRVGLSNARSVAGAMDGDPRLRIAPFMNYHYTGYQAAFSLVEAIKGMRASGGWQRRSPATAMARMYEGTAFLSKPDLLARARTAARAGTPYPLPATW